MIHPLADVQSSNIGKNTRVWQFSVILSDAQIGDDCNINCHTFIENDVLIGNNVTVKSGVQIWDGTRIGNNVFLGPNVTFTNNPYPRSRIYPNLHIGPTIKEGASIGANATIMGGVCIGEYCLVGAGSVITKDTPPYSVWYGNPARLKGYITKGGIVLNQKLEDKEGNQYIQEESGEPKMLEK
jgi:UDP-2-acetamido-3-amino-2,3-dideoxy-glucuronate N-acetyltransferase